MPASSSSSAAARRSGAATPSALAPLVVSGLSVTYPDRTVLAGVDLLAQPGRRIGLVGENGVGKSTLLRAVAGRLPARARVAGIDRRARRPRAARPGAALPRHRHGRRGARHDPGAAADGRRRRRAARRRWSAPPRATRRYERALEAALAHDAWDADRRAEVAAARLGLADLEPDRVVGTLSGGQRTRLALATIMTTRPSLPAARRAHQPPRRRRDRGARPASCASLPGVVVLASHDRVLLDDVCTDLVDLDAGELGHRRQAAAAASAAGGRPTRPRAPTPAGAGRRPAAAQQEEIARLRDATRIGTVVDRPRPRADRRRQVHLLLQGRPRRADPRPPQEGRPAPARGRRARAGAQAAGAARPSAAPDRPRRPGGWCRPASSRSPAGCGWTASTSRQGSTCCSPGPTGPASRPCSACCPAGWRATGGTLEVSARTVRELDPGPGRSPTRGRSALATYDDAVRRPARRPGAARAGAAAPARPPHAGRQPVGRPATAARPGGRDRRRTRPAAARRADQPRLARPGRGAGGGARDRAGRCRPRLARPLAAAPVERARSCALDAVVSASPSPGRRLEQADAMPDAERPVRW